jgi:hypothetical protein
MAYWFGIFWVSVLLFLPCFDGPKRNVLFCCTAGYCVQHIAAMSYQALAVFLPDISSWLDNLLQCIECVIVYSIVYITLGQRIKRNNCINLNNGYIVFFSALTILINIAVSVFRRLEAIGTITEIAESVYSVICCILVLFLQFSVFTQKELKQELDVISYMWTRDREQYELRKEYIEAINIKCHDLKQVLHSLQGEKVPAYKAEMEKAVSLYDSMVKTGNEALDVILSEKSLYCAGRDIRLTCMIDGKKLDFMDDVDIYSCIGNALDNAIEAVQRVAEREKRTIALSMQEEGNFLCIHIENWFEGEIKTENGLPRTTKQDKNSHGFGVKSMRMIAEKYGGNITFSTEDGIFALNLLFPKQ